jgi:Protein of unknown function (DUF2905)
MVRVIRKGVLCGTSARLQKRLLCRSLNYTSGNRIAAMAKWLIIFGVVLILAGLIWPWLSRLGIGHLPGDIHIRRSGFDFYFPLTSSIVVSLVLSLLFWIFRK